MNSNIDKHPRLKRVIKTWETREAKAQQKYDRLKLKDKGERNARTRAAMRELYLIGKFRLHLVQIQLELADFPQLPDSTEAAPSSRPSGTHRKEIFINGHLYEYGYFDNTATITLNSEHWIDDLPPECPVKVVITQDVPEAEAYQLPDSAAVVSVSGSEGANEGTVTISPAEPIANLYLTTIKSQSDGEPTTVNIVGPGKDGPSTILETVKLDGVNPVATKGFYLWGRRNETIQSTKAGAKRRLLARQPKPQSGPPNQKDKDESPQG